MDCYAFCTAASYQIKPLFEALKSRYSALLFRDVIYLEIIHLERHYEFFIFAYGAIVSWGCEKEKTLELLNECKNFEVDRNEEIETDEFSFMYGDQFRVVEDEILLPNESKLTKLAISHGIAQSVKLSSFETTILKTFNNTRDIPHDLAKKGKISLPRSEIRKKMGQLFIERSTISLHVEALDLPEFFWEYSELEPLYRTITSYLELENRVEVLNKRLTIIHELFEVLGNELNHQHSSRLELTIILLIIIEVILSLLRDVFRVI